MNVIVFVLMNVIFSFLEGAGLHLVVADNHPTGSVLLVARGGYLVIANPTSRIMSKGTSFNSGIRLEKEGRYIRWYARGTTTTDSFGIPYARRGNGNCSSAPCVLPFYIRISTAGTGPNGYINFSTWTDTTWTGGPGTYPSWNNFNYRPSDVTHMCPYFWGCPGNQSGYVVDRFWIIGPGGYNPPPTLSEIKFTYHDDEIVVGVNNNTQLDEIDFIAQRFNTSSSKWADWWPNVITRDPANNFIIVGPVPGNNLFRSWTISDQTNPLPITYGIFEGVCNEDNVILKWEVNTPLPVKDVKIYSSKDGSVYSLNGIYLTSEGEIMVENNDIRYYKIEANGLNDELLFEKAIHINCDVNEDIDIKDYGEFVLYLGKGKGSYIFLMYNGEGKLMFKKEGDMTGIITYKLWKRELPAGVYISKAILNNRVITKKINIEK